MAALVVRPRRPPPAVPLAPRPRWQGALLAGATLLALLVLGLGAYVRLSDAGLGCPDWPGCYGKLLGVPASAHELAHAALAFPDRPLDSGRAWKEMTHRYAAGTLGLLVLALALAAWRRQRPWQAPETALLLLVVLQAALGMWTVTLQLKPLIVSLHLVGGMATWALLVWLLREKLAPGRVLPASGRLALALVFVQVGLGGWVSSNYAGLACNSFPGCRAGAGWPDLAFNEGFALQRELGLTAQGDALSFAALSAIHLTHRLGALVVLLGVSSYIVGAWRAAHHATATGGQAAARRFVLAFGALALQIFLGIAVALLHLPLLLAVAHNLGAALLLGALLWTAQAAPRPD